MLLSGWSQVGGVKGVGQMSGMKRIKNRIFSFFCEI